MANVTKVKAKVQKIKAYGSGVYEVEFSVPSRASRFLPGQFLHLTLDEYDPTTGWWPESRVFSIASEPKQDYVTVVYSVKGSYTKRMEKELYIDKTVWLKLPYGDFFIQEATGPIALIAGGTGVSPYWPYLLNGQHTGEVHLFYGVREPSHILFKNKLKWLVDQEWFKLHLMVEDGSVEDLPSSKGRLSTSLFQMTLNSQFTKANYYLSGPPSMIKLFQKELLEKGIDPHKIHIDEWE